MSKTDSGLFKLTFGAKMRTYSNVKFKASKARVKSINPSLIRYSQNSVNGSAELIESMRKNGWKGDPIDVVSMKDGQLTTLDNTRVVAAREANIEVKARVHKFDDPLPDEKTAIRFTTKRGGIPKTWGDAVINRINKQSSGFRKENPNGSYNMKKKR